MNVLITGSTGFLGKYLVPKLIEAGHNVLELTRDADKSEQLFGTVTNKHVITDDQDALTVALNEFKPEIMVHLASYLTSSDSYNDMKKLVDSNLLYMLRLMDALKTSGLKFLINTGTFAEYFKGDESIDPAYLYAATKSASRYFVDYYSKAYGFKAATVIPYTIYGGIDSQKKIIDYIYESIGAAAPVDMSPGGQVLDFIHVDDVVDFYLELIDNYQRVADKSVFKLGTGVGHTIKELAEVIAQKSGRSCNINWGGKSYRPTDVMYAVADISAQNNLFDWDAKVTLEMGVENYLRTKNS
ncbi:NAD(P)-dependent oxidoreductase [Mucilaginibacter gossypii]|uniref:NAD-dependent epimerase/dehydratase family protein n=1 Tax=Mucilaginibacter gossypii TaxID=551996 RepID=UPI000DCD9830|nr:MULTISPECIES: NAD(P)-dependent oxidoreductase [Mucilaginibacter]QTE40257.1 NAD(P)-dependent oxidoreductase [Mucilaginibacter gossypii]RAV57540.1 NAD(P)-dependent oxidoreductase [Mucilaginibacter rubeus]